MLVISSPSGAGKTSLSRRLIADYPALRLSISVTTRAPRPGEQDGREYRFVSDAEFAAMQAEGAFLEWAQVHDNRYGSPAGPALATLAGGEDVLFDIDWQGALSVAAYAPADTVKVFILPPSLQALAERLRTRAQDSEAVIARRLAGARTEIEKWDRYDYVIVNDDFEAAYHTLSNLYLAERERRERNLWLAPFVDGLLKT